MVRQVGPERSDPGDPAGLHFEAPAAAPETVGARAEEIRDGGLDRKGSLEIGRLLDAGQALDNGGRPRDPA